MVVAAEAAYAEWEAGNETVCRAYFRALRALVLVPALAAVGDGGVASVGQKCGLLSQDGLD